MKQPKLLRIVTKFQQDILVLRKKEETGPLVKLEDFRKGSEVQVAPPFEPRKKLGPTFHWILAGWGRDPYYFMVYEKNPLIYLCRKFHPLYNPKKTGARTFHCSFRNQKKISIIPGDPEKSFPQGPTWRWYRFIHLFLAADAKVLTALANSAGKKTVVWRFDPGTLEWYPNPCFGGINPHLSAF